MHTADPGGTGANEVTGGAGPYARQAVTFNAAAGKHADAVSALNFPGMPAVTVTHISLWSAASGGTEWLEGSLAVQKSVNAGDTFQLPASDIDFDLT